MKTPDYTNDAAVESFIASYRDVVQEWELATTEIGRSEWRSVIDRMRREWCEYAGEDSLHEMAFGEPE